MQGGSGHHGGHGARLGPRQPPRRPLGEAGPLVAPPASAGSGRLAVLLVVVALAVTGLVAVTVAGAGSPLGRPDRPALADRPATGPAGGPSSGPAARQARAPGTTAGSSAAAPEQPTTTVPGPTRVTLAFAGDLLPHSAVNEHAAALGGGRVAHDFAPMLEPLRPVLEPADLALCHMEVPLAPVGEEVTSYPSFGAPAELVDGVASAGYDGCSTASNHSLDRGRAGIDHTLARMDSLGLGHTGTARTAEEARPASYDLGGMQVVHLSYAYGFNGYRIPADAPWAVNPIDPARIRADAAAARAVGAELVVVSLHWGEEYRHEPSPYQREVAAALVPSPDIDLVIGHHAHVVQPIEQLGGTYVVWGLGNQLSNMTQEPRRDGLTVVATADRGADGRWAVTGVEAVPTWVDLATFRVLPVVPALADPATPEPLRAELQASYDRTVGVLLGAPTAGLTVAPRP